MKHNLKLKATISNRGLLKSYPAWWILGFHYIFFYIFIATTVGAWVKETFSRKRTYLLVGFFLFIYQYFTTTISVLNGSSIDFSRFIAISHNYLIFLMIFMAAAVFEKSKFSSYISRSIKSLTIFYCLTSISLYGFTFIMGNNEMVIHYPWMAVQFVGIGYSFDDTVPRLTFLGTYSNTSAIFCFSLFVLYSSTNLLKDRFVTRLAIWTLVSVTIILTGSRISLVASICFLPFLAPSKKAPLLASLLLAIFAAAYILFFTNFLELLQSARSGSNSTRLKIYTTSIEMMLRESPLFGIGYKPYTSTVIDYPLGSHSTPIGYFFKNGIIGGLICLLCYLYFLINWLKQILKLFSSQANKNPLLLSNTAGIILLLLIYCFEDMDSYEINAILFGFIISTFFQLKRNRNASRNNTQALG